LAAEALAGQARSLVRQGRPAEALPLASEAWAAAKDLAEPFTVVQAALGLAHARWANGERPGALEAAKSALALLQGREDGFLRGQVEGWLKGKELAVAPK
jgi:hypothetical protein